VPDSTRFAGLDVHRDTVVVALAPAAGPVEQVVELPHHLPRLRAFFEKLARLFPVKACYEAGGCGYGLQRAMASWGVECVVIAPSLIPRKPGERCKTDRRDAIRLAESYRAGQLTPVHVPTEAEERVRGLTRARQSVVGDVHQCRQRVLKLLQLRGLVYREGRSAWTKKFHDWLVALLPTLPELDRLVLSTHISAIDHNTLLRAGLDQEIEKIATQEPYCATVSRLRCLRGVDTLTALSLVAEIGDVRRFDTPRRLMGYLGLNVSERSSGGTQRRGGITKAGNSRCRRLLIEAAWNYRHAPKGSVAIRKRREGQPPDVISHAARAEVRLHKRFAALLERMPSQKAVTAVARELAGFVWAQMRGTADVLTAKAQ